MRIATLGFIATTLFATTIVPVADAGSRERGSEHKMERVDSREFRGYRNEGRDYGRRQANRSNYRRHYRDGMYGRRYTNGHRYNRRGRGHGRYYGHRRIVFSHGSHGYGNPMPAIAGGIIGGAIANGASGGDQGATVVGAVIGAVIASDSARRRSHH
ncbi:MAG: hypothetical protein ACC641_07640 [Acidiferrobacterales bacterium]